MTTSFTLLPEIGKKTMLRAILAFGLLLSGCSDTHSPNSHYQPTFSKTPPQVTKTYLFGVHPLHNPERLYEIFNPLMEYLNQHFTDVQFRLEASRNYASYDRKLKKSHFHFALPNPYQTLFSLDYRYRVFGKMADDHNFKGIILVRKDSKIEKVTDLKGKAVSFPAPTALAATMMPQYYLQEHGLDVMKDIDIRYVGSQESSIMNVFLGNTAAGSTWIPPWEALSRERPELKEQLVIQWETEPLPNNALVVRDDISSDTVKKVSELLFNLHTHKPGKEILARMELSRFSQADNKTYEPVRAFLDKFHQKVRSIR